MATQKWCIGQPRFYGKVKEGPDGEDVDGYLGELPPRTVVSFSERQRKIKGVLWSEITYKNSKGEDVLGWVKDGFLEDVVENQKFAKAEVHIPHPSIDPNDPPQYLMWDSETVVKTNMCSELSVSFVGGDDIETFLRKWEAHDNLYYPWAVKGERNKPLDWRHIDKMLEVYGYPSPNLKFKDGLTDSGIGFVPTPGRIKKLLETRFLIARVRIDSSGKIRPEAGQWIGHWVVVDKIEPYGVNRGRVEIYNPFPNKREEYSYVDFIKSCAPGYSGLWVNRVLPSQVGQPG